MDKNWDEIKKQAMVYAKENMTSRKMNCSEAVLEALIRCGAIDVPLETVAYATGFGGGAGGAGYTCGALASAILANGVVHGRKNPSSAAVKTELKDKYYQRYNHIAADFAKMAGSGLCSEIVNAFPDAFADVNNRPNCIRIVTEAAGIAVDYIKMDVEQTAKLGYDPSVVRIRNWI